MNAALPDVDPKSYAHAVGAVMKDRCISHWLKRALLDLERRDPVDALDDLETALRLARIRYEEAAS